MCVWKSSTIPGTSFSDNRIDRWEGRAGSVCCTTVPLVTPCVSVFLSKQFSGFLLQLVSYNLIQFWHFLPGDSIRFHRFKAQPHKTPPTSDADHKPWLLLWLWPPGYNSEVPISFYSGSMYLPELLIELRKTFYLVDYQFITKDITQGKPNGEMHRARYVGRGVELHALSGCATPQIFTCSAPNLVFLWFLWSLHFLPRHVDWIIDHW